MLWLRVKGSVAGGAYCVCWRGIRVLWLRVKGSAPCKPFGLEVRVQGFCRFRG